MIKEKKLKKLGLKALFVMMTTLQKGQKIGMKMAKSLLFMNQFPPNQHIMSFFVHKNHCVKLKLEKKKMKKLGLKALHRGECLSKIQGQSVARVLIFQVIVQNVMVLISPKKN